MCHIRSSSCALPIGFGIKDEFKIYYAINVSFYFSKWFWYFSSLFSDFAKYLKRFFCAQSTKMKKAAINQFCAVPIHSSCVALQIETPTTNVHSISHRESERQLKDKNVPLIAIIKLLIISELAIGMDVNVYERAAFVRNINRHYNSPLRLMLLLLPSLTPLLELLNISNTSIRQLNRLKTFKMICLNYSMYWLHAMLWYSSIHMSVNIHGLSDSCIFLFSVVQVTFLRLLLSDVFQSCIVV